MSILDNDKWCFHLKCLLYVRYFLNMSLNQDIHVIAIHAFPKIYLGIKMSDFKGKNGIIFVLFEYTRQDICKLKIAASNLKIDQ